ncbi:MAG: LOG family protein [Pseudonocardiales bacterium]|nr:LOG family protein [Pseudonocardiales bacterium]MBV9029658.1 LOG family protein [Pseudonocardiales bacterium]MBW0010834.1 LOG family protein [Pseudonocardiales bacterium]
MRIGILGGLGWCPGASFDDALQGLGAELGRRRWDMVLGVPGPVALDTIGPGVDVVEVLPRGAEPGSCATDRRAVDGPVARMDVVRLLSDAVVMIPGGIEVLADLLALLTEQALGLSAKPCGVLDPDDLLNPLAEQLDALDRAGLPAAPLLRAGDPAQLLDQLAAWRPDGGGDVREEVAWLRINDAGLALLPSAAGLRLPGGPHGPGERGAVALCRLMDQRWSVPLRPERLRPVAALMVPDGGGGWRRVSCYRAQGPQPVVPGAVAHPVGETAACEPAAAALQDLLRRGRVR